MPIAGIALTDTFVKVVALVWTTRGLFLQMPRPIRHIATPTGGLQALNRSHEPLEMATLQLQHALVEKSWSISEALASNESDKERQQAGHPRPPDRCFPFELWVRTSSSSSTGQA